MVFFQSWQIRREFRAAFSREWCLASAGKAKAPGKYALLSVKPVFRLVEHNRLRPVHDLVGHLFTAMCRKAMHEYGVWLRLFHQVFVHLKGNKDIVAARAVLLVHRNPGIGDDTVRAR